MNFIPTESITCDRVQIMSWQSFLPRNIHEKVGQKDMDSSSTSLISQSLSIPFFYDPCQATTSNLAFYINPQQRPDIV
jgi:hypothetical protein